MNSNLLTGCLEVYTEKLIDPNIFKQYLVIMFDRLCNVNFNPEKLPTYLS